MLEALFSLPADACDSVRFVKSSRSAAQKHEVRARITVTSTNLLKTSVPTEALQLRESSADYHAEKAAGH